MVSASAHGVGVTTMRDDGRRHGGVRREGRGKRTQSTAPSWAHAHPLDIARLPDRGPRPGRAAVLAPCRGAERSDGRRF